MVLICLLHNLNYPLVHLLFQTILMSDVGIGPMSLIVIV
jgi:hypothetical protein